MSKKDDALRLALEALELYYDLHEEEADLKAITAVREALADSALERIAENERELGLDYMEPAQQPYAQTAAYIKSTTNGRMHVDPVTGDVSIGKKQPAQQHEPHVPVKDNTYGYAKSLAEAIFKRHFASDEHYASGRIVWGVNDTVIGILTQIDNMVADMVRRPAQQEPVANPYAYEYGRDNGDGTYSVVIEKGDLVQTAPAVYNYVRPRNAHKDWPIKELFDHPPASKPLTFSKLCDIEYEITHRDGDFSILKFARAIEAAHGIKGEA